MTTPDQLMATISELEEYLAKYVKVYKSKLMEPHVRALLENSYKDLLRDIAMNDLKVARFIWLTALMTDGALSEVIWEHIKDTPEGVSKEARLQAILDDLSLYELIAVAEDRATKNDL